MTRAHIGRHPQLMGWIVWSLIGLSACTHGPAPSNTYDWRADWVVADGFAINVDTTGYQLPTAIAFVPSPGPDPKDPPDQAAP